MSRLKKLYIHYILLIVNLIIGSIIFSYFWQIFDSSTLYVPPLIMIIALVYVVVELIKKYVHVVLTTWNKLYYIGLIAVVSPTAFESKIEPATIELIAKYGSIFLIIPIIIETVIVKAYFKKQSTKE